ncbi:hypothetical protein MAPG_11958 [Magnaporthiopsis poae ATCC 64411]|uniref:Uncharacterized protein n=1 Tax=Magnaporthiopsis poae (strain ATCC 64411 / 73-15) TaxID=644358 RepID=A0A0C4EGK3_MAGP6|nr:hypothetical protein MAPG_11958 [Magnaporthiopsis poae ATCC 64411]
MSAGAKELCGVAHKATPPYPRQSPRPFMSKFSVLSLLLREMCGTAHGSTVACHARYGRIVRAGQFSTSVTDADAVRAVLVSDDLPEASLYKAIRVNRHAFKLLQVSAQTEARVTRYHTAHTGAGARRPLDVIAHNGRGPAGVTDGITL